MARHSITVTIEETGRDQGKTFVLTEMPAVAGEKWAMQLAWLVSQAGADMDPALLTAGMAGLSEVQRANAVAFARALQDPSLDAWWECVRYQHQVNHPLQPINFGAACQIEEIATIARLRGEVVALHLGFSQPASPSTTASPSLATPIPTHSSPTRISRPQSAP